jgi:diguanylate cyclase (GGDEF)-like protein
LVLSGVLLAILAVTIALLVAMAAALVAALNGRGPLHGRFLEVERKPTKQRDPGRQPGSSTPERADPVGVVDDYRPQSVVRIAPRERRPNTRPETLPGRTLNVWDDELDEVLRGSYAAATFDRAVRILAWTFILVILLSVSASGLWPREQPAIYATLILAGMFILIAHELMPATRPGSTRIVIEASVAIVFIGLLVGLTGHADSPFFFLLPVLVGGLALITPPPVTLVLTVETAIVYLIAALSGPLSGQAGTDSLTRAGINLAALVLLTYSGMIVARVQRRTRDAAVKLSTLDPLTDLYNRAFLFNTVDREIHRGRRYKRGFCLLMMDLDGLKSINDRYGHFQGDAILRGAAQLIKDGLRSIDVAARYGGDEFVAVLPETDPTGAYVVAEKIRRGVSELTIESGGQQIRTSLSIGVVSYPDDGQTADELMIAADEAMYSSKRLGKNKVVGYAEPAEPIGQHELSPWPHTATPGFRPLSKDPNHSPPDEPR